MIFGDFLKINSVVLKVEYIVRLLFVFSTLLFDKKITGGAIHSSFIMFQHLYLIISTSSFMML